ncbi:MAG: tRNA (N(6)-L-threonylcarbamoyladenosine(37)-C(2))-methylthiotransferase MtaB [Calditrichia bacterium]
MNRVSFYTLGCRLNQAETAIMQSSFEKNGFQVVDFKQPAEVVVVNTCTVTENGDADTRKVVNKINRINPAARIALVGCQAQIQREKLLDMPNVRWVVGNALKMDLAEILQKSGKDEPAQTMVPVISRDSFTHSAPGIDRQHTRANLKIQDGCDFFCSFCVIPFARGRARSRVFNDILQEAGLLLQAGHRELVLTGINVGTYRFRELGIADVIDALLQLKKLERLRISSIEPTTIPWPLIERMQDSPKLCRYLHIPLQSGSPEILKAMNRQYSVADFRSFIEEVHKALPQACLGTDVIVGFPGETDRHFRQTYDLLRELPLAYFHVFSYSERPWAKSRNLPGKVDAAVIEQRSRLLRELSARKRRLFMEDKIGTAPLVLFEQKKKGYWSGLTDTYIRVKVKCDLQLSNKILPVRLNHVAGNFMSGTLLSAEEN